MSSEELKKLLISFFGNEAEAESFVRKMCVYGFSTRGQSTPDGDPFELWCRIRQEADDPITALLVRTQQVLKERKW